MQVKQYIIDRSYQASKGIAAAVLVCLGIGLLPQTIGQLTEVEWLINIVSANEVAGLGLCTFVSPLYMVSHEGIEMLLYFLLVSVVIPAAICLLLRPIAFKQGWLKGEDMKVELN